MINEIITAVTRFILLVLLQVLLLDNIELSGYINPYLYVIFLALLPIETPGWLVLIAGFLLGFTIDMFSHTPGLHTSASVFAAFSRKFLLKLMEPRDGYSNVSSPTMSVMGLRWFVVYTALLVAAHHLFFFYAESFRFTGFFHTLWRVIMSFLATMVLVVFTQYFTLKPKTR